MMSYNYDGAITNRFHISGVGEFNGPQRGGTRPAMPVRGSKLHAMVMKPVVHALCGAGGQAPLVRAASIQGALRQRMSDRPFFVPDRPARRRDERQVVRAQPLHSLQCAAAMADFAPSSE